MHPEVLGIFAHLCRDDAASRRHIGGTARRRPVNKQRFSFSFLLGDVVLASSVSFYRRGTHTKSSDIIVFPFESKYILSHAMLTCFAWTRSRSKPDLCGRCCCCCWSALRKVSLARCCYLPLSSHGERSFGSPYL